MVKYIGRDELTGDKVLIPSGGTGIYTASEALNANDIVNIYDDAGTASMRKADATDATKFAHGYVKDAVALNDMGTVYFNGVLPVTVAAADMGKTHFLSSITPGLAVMLPNFTAGNIVQELGVATSNGILFDPEEPELN